MGVKGAINAIEIAPSTGPAHARPQIAEALKHDGEIEARAIRVNVQDSRVILDGKVRISSERHSAERAAWGGTGGRQPLSACCRGEAGFRGSARSPPKRGQRRDGDVFSCPERERVPRSRGNSWSAVVSSKGCGGTADDRHRRLGNGPPPTPPSFRVAPDAFGSDPDMPGHPRPEQRGISPVGRVRKE